MRRTGCVVLAVVLGWGPVLSAQEAKAAKAKEPKKGPDAPQVRIFNPETMVKPTAGYSQVAEVSDGKMVFIAGQVAQDRNGNLVGRDDLPRCSRSSTICGPRLKRQAETSRMS